MWWRIWIRIGSEYVVVVYGNSDDDDAVVIYGIDVLITRKDTRSVQKVHFPRFPNKRASRRAIKTARK